MNEFFSSPFFGIVLCIVCFQIGMALNKKLKNPLINPLLIAIILIIITLKITGIPLASFSKGAEIISLFLLPATAILAVSIYRQISILKTYSVPILIGTIFGSISSIISVIVLCSLFGLDETICASLVPKSVTTAIAIDLSSQRGGIPSVTVFAVVLTGITGAVLSPLLIKVLHIKNPIVQGVAIGTCSHVIGTSKALELGEIQGAMSSVSIACAGIATALLLFIF